MNFVARNPDVENGLFSWRKPITKVVVGHLLFWSDEGRPRSHCPVRNHHECPDVPDRLRSRFETIAWGWGQLCHSERQPRPDGDVWRLVGGPRNGQSSNLGHMVHDPRCRRTGSGDSVSIGCGSRDRTWPLEGSGFACGPRLHRRGYQRLASSSQSAGAFAEFVGRDRGGRCKPRRGDQAVCRYCDAFSRIGLTAASCSIGDQTGKSGGRLRRGSIPPMYEGVSRSGHGLALASATGDIAMESLRPWALWFTPWPRFQSGRSG